jgi:hypothetical protein
MQPTLKIISGGRTGVERAALDAALACGLATGGCPSEEANVRDAHATLIITPGELDRASRSIAETARRLGKPCIVASLRSYPRLVALEEILPAGRQEVVLNVAAPRESRRAGTYARAFGFLVTVFRSERRTGFELQLTPAPSRVAKPLPRPRGGARILREPPGASLF